MLCAFTYVTSHCCTTFSTESPKWQVHKIHEFNQVRAPPKAHRTKPGTNPHTVPSLLLLHLSSTSEEPSGETMSPDYNVNFAIVNNGVAGMTIYMPVNGGSICFAGD